jgi:galactoside 2-L-fucosyltransferase 1/2
VNPLTWKLFLFLVSIPLGALYIGYAIGNYLMPPTRKFPDKGVVVDIGSLNYSWYNTHNITIGYIGGVGNHMFQYASMYGVARANGLKPITTTDNRLVDIFPLLKAKIVISEKQFVGYSTFNEFNPSAFDGRAFSLNFMKNMKLEGFFQSWRYFDHIRADIRKQYTFPSEIRQKVHGTMLDIYKLYREHVDAAVLEDTKHPVQFVGVHIRRGDTLDPYNVDKGYTVADGAYLHRAVDFYDVT